MLATLASEDRLLLIGSCLIFISVVSNKISVRLGVPTLIFFLVVGIVAKTRNLVGEDLEKTKDVAKLLGNITLVLILFFGGISTDLEHVKPVLVSGVILSTLGVVLTAGTVGIFLHWAGTGNFQLSLSEGVLIGAIIASTDAVAVFSVLRSRKMQLKDNLGPMLEFESGSNDVMVYFMMTFLLELVTHGHASFGHAILLFFQQMVIGGLGGFVAGRATLWLLNNINLKHQGLYPALTLSMIFLFYGLIQQLGGSGFLGVYIAGMLMGKYDFIHKKSFDTFGRGVEWIMQMMMFISLGLLVNPPELYHAIPLGTQLSLVLMLIARPLSVFVCLLFSKFKLNHKMFISWVGLRGAVPIVFAIMHLHGVDPAKQGPIFHLIFFVVLFSVLIQGATLYPFAQWLKLEDTVVEAKRKGQVLELLDDEKKLFIQLEIPSNSPAHDKPVVALDLGGNILIVLVYRDHRYFAPQGSTVLKAGDKLFLVVDSKKDIKKAKECLGIV